MKAFYARFKDEYAAFLALCKGGNGQASRERYASLIIIYTMAVYFIQKKGLLAAQGTGLLNGDPDYLAHCIEKLQAECGQGNFHTFYRSLLLKLFHAGSVPSADWPEVEALPGQVPYLNGQVLDIGTLMDETRAIEVSDEAFERLLRFFAEFEWRLDDHPLFSDRVIGPHVIGTLFEKYIHQKQMGAYYTQEDITEYIGKSCILPRLLTCVAQQWPAAFRAHGEVWELLRTNPERYIYPSVQHGCALPLPPEIEAGVDDSMRRAAWDVLAAREYGLPEETWREVVARRQRYAHVKARLLNGEICSGDELITCNLDIWRFAEDIILSTSSPALLAAFYASLEELTVLDPTCGSGAFLFAALTILEPLYAACLQRMRLLIEEQEQRGVQWDEERDWPVLSGLRTYLSQLEQDPNRRSFICRSIITKNLYGVDLMREATEICRLGLFLKLVARLERVADLRSLPAVNFNIRTGNALVGMARPSEEFGSQDERNESACQPFHWLLVWPEIMRNGGFDVIIGNPPYVAYNSVKDAYQVQLYETQACGNLCAYVLERALRLLRPQGRCGMIVPVSAIASEKYRPLSQLLSSKQLWISSYSNRPAKLFVGVEQRLAIVLLHNIEARVVLASSYQHWYEAERAHLFTTLSYTATAIWTETGMPLKAGSALAEAIFARMAQQQGFPLLANRRSGAAVWIHNGPTYWVRALPFEPNTGPHSRRSVHYCQIPVASQDAAFVLAAILSSSTFYFFYKLISNCRDLGQKELHLFPLGALQPASEERLVRLGRLLADHLKTTAEHRTRRYLSREKITYEVMYEEYYPMTARALLDEIDRVLAEHYGFSDEELDFLLHYDLKYRLLQKTVRKALPLEAELRR